MLPTTKIYKNDKFGGKVFKVNIIFTGIFYVFDLLLGDRE